MSFIASRGRGTGFAGPQAQWPPRGWSLRLQTCLSRFGQATEAKRPASRGLQGLGSDKQCATVGAYRSPNIAVPTRTIVLPA
jgi:hypothetical protein